MRVALRGSELDRKLGLLLELRGQLDGLVERLRVPTSEALRHVLGRLILLLSFAKA